MDVNDPRAPGKLPGPFLFFFLLDVETANLNFVLRFVRHHGCGAGQRRQKEILDSSVGNAKAEMGYALDGPAGGNYTDKAGMENDR